MSVYVPEWIKYTHSVSRNNIGKLQVIAECAKRVFYVGQIAPKDSQPDCPKCRETIK